MQCFFVREKLKSCLDPALSTDIPFLSHFPFDFYHSLSVKNEDKEDDIHSLWVKKTVF